MKSSASPSAGWSDEYDAAQERGEASTGGRPKSVPAENGFTADDLGLSGKEVHEARTIRDGEKADPGMGTPLQFSGLIRFVQAMSLVSGRRHSSQRNRQRRSSEKESSMKQGKAKGYRVALKDDAGSTLHVGPFSSMERAERALRVLLTTFDGSDPLIGCAVAWKIRFTKTGPCPGNLSDWPATHDQRSVARWPWR